ncbi:MAG: MoaD/ThiS family protein [Deltaproteobacteria bacterium]|jgi:sulfur carrier protein ThiS|nr:MoaD/ThiS family protein [Deltaproteobacteria bacterium]
MQITVSLHGIFRRERFKEQLFDYPSGTKVQEVIDDLQIPIPLLGIVLINGVHAECADILNVDDKLSLLPLLDGG